MLHKKNKGGCLLNPIYKTLEDHPLFPNLWFTLPPRPTKNCPLLAFNIQTDRSDTTNAAIMRNPSELLEEVVVVAVVVLAAGLMVYALPLLV